MRYSHISNTQKRGDGRGRKGGGCFLHLQQRGLPAFKFKIFTPQNLLSAILIVLLGDCHVLFVLSWIFVLYLPLTLLSSSFNPIVSFSKV